MIPEPGKEGVPSFILSTLSSYISIHCRKVGEPQKRGQKEHKSQKIGCEVLSSGHGQSMKSWPYNRGGCLQWVIDWGGCSQGPASWELWDINGFRRRLSHCLQLCALPEALTGLRGIVPKPWDTHSNPTFVTPSGSQDKQQSKQTNPEWRWERDAQGSDGGGQERSDQIRYALCTIWNCQKTNPEKVTFKYTFPTTFQNGSEHPMLRGFIFTNTIDSLKYLGV